MSGTLEHISISVDRILEDNVDPRIREAAEREAQGEKIDWPALYAEIDANDTPCGQQLQLGICS